jgi:hypothetical protein
MVAEKRRGGLYDQAVVLNEARFVLVSCWYMSKGLRDENCKGVISNL